MVRMIGWTSTLIVHPISGPRLCSPYFQLTFNLSLTLQVHAFFYPDASPRPEIVFWNALPLYQRYCKRLGHKCLVSKFQCVSFLSLHKHHVEYKYSSGRQSKTSRSLRDRNNADHQVEGITYNTGESMPNLWNPGFN